MSKLCPTCEKITIFDLCNECVKCKRKENWDKVKTSKQIPVVFDPNDPTYHDPWK